MFYFFILYCSYRFAFRRFIAEEDYSSEMRRKKVEDRKSGQADNTNGRSYITSNASYTSIEIPSMPIGGRKHLQVKMRATVFGAIEFV